MDTENISVYANLVCLTSFTKILRPKEEGKMLYWFLFL